MIGKTTKQGEVGVCMLVVEVPLTFPLSRAPPPSAGDVCSGNLPENLEFPFILSCFRRVGYDMTLTVCDTDLILKENRSNVEISSRIA